MSQADIVKQGANRYFADCGRYENPYPSNSPEFNDFERGWMQALKKDNGQVAAARQRDDDVREQQQQMLASEEMATVAQCYRSLKG